MELSPSPAGGRRDLQIERRPPSWGRRELLGGGRRSAHCHRARWERASSASEGEGLGGVSASRSASSLSRVASSLLS